MAAGTRLDNFGTASLSQNGSRYTDLQDRDVPKAAMNVVHIPADGSKIVPCNSANILIIYVASQILIFVLQTDLLQSSFVSFWMSRGASRTHALFDDCNRRSSQFSDSKNVPLGFECISDAREIRVDWVTIFGKTLIDFFRTNSST